MIICIHLDACTGLSIALLRFIFLGRFHNGSVSSSPQFTFVFLTYVNHRHKDYKNVAKRGKNIDKSKKKSLFQHVSDCLQGPCNSLVKSMGNRLKLHLSLVKSLGKSMGYPDRISIFSTVPLWACNNNTRTAILKGWVKGGAEF